MRNFSVRSVFLIRRCLNDKNAILFVIDSLSYERITGNETSHLTPCFHRLMQEHISCSRMYSQAPYTEAVLMGLR